jgi:hypothetical protein
VMMTRVATQIRWYKKTLDQDTSAASATNFATTGKCIRSGQRLGSGMPKCQFRDVRRRTRTYQLH